MITTPRLWAAIGWLSLLLCLVIPPVAAEREVGYIGVTDIEGVNRQVRLDRKPALYTGDFGDCLDGESLLNVTKFDAGIYTDNVTVVFHLDGTTSLKSEAVMIHISLFAYGEERFKMIFDPCHANIHSLCPMNASVPITAYGMWFLTPQQIEGIPSIAYQIPDFDGYTRVQIFANSTQTLIGCFQADMTNGNTLSYPTIVSPFIGLFAAAALIASFLTAAYGDSVPNMRSHYAHSLSGLVVFETLQTVFFTGMLSLNWPKVLPAWWSNFSWSAGLVNIAPLVNAVDRFAGISGNSSQVGGAGSTTVHNHGGILREIYGRSLKRMVGDIATRLVSADTTSAIAKRAPFNESNPADYTWAGKPVHPGVPLPGTWFGFAGTMASLNIPDADAFTISLVCLFIFLALVAVAVAVFTLALGVMTKMKWIKNDHFTYFQSHCVRYIVLAVLRCVFVAFIMVMTLALYQFALHGPAGPTALAAVFFLVFLVAMGGLVTYACYFRIRLGQYTFDSGRLEFRRQKLWKIIPAISTKLKSSRPATEKPEIPAPIGSVPFPHIRHIDDNPSRHNIHQDQPYLKRFGWLAARYRRTRWWFFAAWLLYHLVRACLLGGASNTPTTQVYGLLVVDIIAFLLFIKLKPFESRRNMALAVWMLGLSKIATTALSIAFLPGKISNAIISTAVGVIIVIIQGLLVIGMFILIVLGCLSTWMSLCRNREKFSATLNNRRRKYYDHIAMRAPDVPLPKKGKSAEGDLTPSEPAFAVKTVRRQPKIEDEDDDVLEDIERPQPPAFAAGDSRTNSLHSRLSVGSLPRAARAHRASWSSRDFLTWDAQLLERSNSSLAHRLSNAHGPSNSLSMQTLAERPGSSGEGETGAVVERPPAPIARPTTPGRQLLEMYSQERFGTIPEPESSTTTEEIVREFPPER